MYCSKCGAQIDDDSVFCKECGYKVKQINEDRFESISSVMHNDGITIAKKKSKAPKIIAALMILIIAVAAILFVVISNRTYVGGWVPGKSSNYYNNETEIYTFRIYHNHEFAYMTSSLEKYTGSWQKSDDAKDVIIANCNGQVITINYNRITDTIKIEVTDGGLHRPYTGNFQRNDNLEW